jgi:hypothetical protein
MKAYLCCKKNSNVGCISFIFNGHFRKACGRGTMERYWWKINIMCILKKHVKGLLWSIDGT